MENDENDYIELNAFIRVNGLANTGGQAKLLIRSGAVSVNGEPETRNKRKLYERDKVKCNGKEFIVKKEVIK
ncbi:MAG: RNA-binding S4 domain-containing protein [Candidatus Woesearchaeota archaeon]|nr:RNA-binding S4 domain-containing protein [Candidatus Woesearchaeota archaeon]